MEFVVVSTIYVIIAAMAIAYLFFCSATKSVLIGGILTAFFFLAISGKININCLQA